LGVVFLVLVKQPIETAVAEVLTNGTFWLRLGNALADLLDRNFLRLDQPLEAIVSSVKSGR